MAMDRLRVGRILGDRGDQAWIRPFLPVFIAISAVGLILSLWVHLGAVMGQRVAPEAFFWILHIGIFIVWFPAVFLAQKLVRNVNRKDFWKAVLKDAPLWMRYMIYGFLGYAIVNFLFFMVNAPGGGSGANPHAAVWRGFSGHWMVFYSAALAILYSANRNQAALTSVNPRALDNLGPAACEFLPRNHCQDSRSPNLLYINNIRNGVLCPN